MTRDAWACAAARLLADFDDEDDCAEADARAEAARVPRPAARAEAGARAMWPRPIAARICIRTG